MRISEIEVLPIDRYLFVRVHTDAGITGLGESGAWGYLEASGSAVETFKRYLIGQDPLRIEHHWQYLYRWTHFRGAAIMGALSAIDIALWDIAGKHFGVPCYQLLGGKTRDKARVYYHVFGQTTEELVQGCIDAKAAGFTAVGHLTPFLDEPRDVRYFKTHARKMDDAIGTVRRYREAVGDDVDLCIEIHRRLTPSEATSWPAASSSTTPSSTRTPSCPTASTPWPRWPRASTSPSPRASGCTPSGSSRRSWRAGRCSSCGRTCAWPAGCRTRKIAALAEAHHVQVVPHNPLSPVSTAACIQLAACIPNFALQEYPKGEGQPPKSEIVTSPLRLEDGFLIVPDAPGLGIELAAGALERHPYKPRAVHTRLNTDGSVMDQ